MTTGTRTLTAIAEPVPAHDGPSARLAQGGGWWTFILALTMLVALTEALNTAAWSEGLGIVRLAVLGGALLGFALSLTRWQGIFPAAYGLLASAAWITTLFNQYIFNDLTREEGVRELVIRNVNWLAALIDGAASADNLIFVTQLAFLGWWIGYLALWNLMRHQRLLHAVIPAGAALLVNVYYAAQNLTGFLAVFLGAVILLAIRLELARNEMRWQLTRVRYAPDIAFDFLKAGLGFTILVLALAWTLPNAAERLNAERLLRPFESSWQKLEDTWNRMYKSLNYSAAAIPVSAFGKTTALGGPVSLTDRPIFQAESPERTYWRAAVFDAYTGTGWINTDADVVVIEENAPLNEPDFSRTRELTVTVQSLEQGQTIIFAPPHPARASVPTNAETTAISEAAALRTVSLLRSRVSLDNEPYQVVSRLTNASPDELRRDTTNYPPWISQRYLQLPDTLPQRIRDLAVQTAAGHDTPYDKAEALEALLRTYTYNQQIAAPPAGSDGVDYFLFEVQQGYCDYYASALVVMLRAVGIPARFAVGYTAGETLEISARPTNSALNLYRILERNAHAWPEVYFPSYGWVQFEPTASEPQIVRPTPEPEAPLDAGLAPDIERGPMENADLGMEDLVPTEAAEGETASGMQRWLRGNWGWLAAALLAAAAWGGWRLARARQAAFFGHREALARLFGLLGLWAARLKVPWLPGQTPLERAAAFNETLPEAAPAVDTIAGLFVAQQYGRQQPAPEVMTTVAERWRALQPALWRRWLVGAVAKPDAPPETAEDPG